MGVATQNPQLRKRFTGKPEYVVNFMRFIAQNLREYMARLGVRTVDELVGQMCIRDRRARIETRKHFGNGVYMFTPIYIANYCENFCIYCGFNCHNKINRAQLNEEEIDKEMQEIAKTGLQEILILTGESRSKSTVEYIGKACRIARRCV